MAPASESPDSGLLDIVLPGASLEELKKWAAMMATQLREEHRHVVESNLESTRALVWLTGLLGAGIFSVHQVLASAPFSVRLYTYMWWAFGILMAVTGRLLDQQLNTRLTGEHIKRVTTLDLLQLSNDKALVEKALRPLIARASEPREQDTKLRILLLATNAANYLTYIALVVGAVAATMMTILWGK